MVFVFKGYSQDSTVIRPAPSKGSFAAKEPASAPFAFGDFSWLNGTSRKTSPPLIDSKYFTSDITLDLNYTHSYNNPIDNTVVGSTALSRDNELTAFLFGIWRRSACGQCPRKDHDAVWDPVDGGSAE